MVKTWIGKKKHSPYFMKEIIGKKRNNRNVDVLFSCISQPQYDKCAWKRECCDFTPQRKTVSAHKYFSGNSEAS